MAIAAQTMDYLRARGYPIPAIAEVSSDGTGLVLDRINGRSMFADLSRRPWTLKQRSGVLADLQRLLTRIEPRL